MIILISSRKVKTSVMRAAAQEFPLCSSGIGGLSGALGGRFDPLADTVGLRNWRCHSCGVGPSCGSDLILALHRGLRIQWLPDLIAGLGIPCSMGQEEKKKRLFLRRGATGHFGSSPFFESWKA